MIAADLHQTLATHASSTAEELADELYAAVRGAMSRGQERDQLYALLTSLYAELQARGLSRERRAVGEVIRCFDGYVAPEAAL